MKPNLKLQQASGALNCNCVLFSLKFLKTLLESIYIYGKSLLYSDYLAYLVVTKSYIKTLCNDPT